MNILTIVLMFLASHSTTADSITIEHVGISDKPIPTITIFKNSNSGLKEGEYATDSKIFEKLVKVIKANDKNEKTEGNEFGTFSFAVDEGGVKSISSHNKKKSIELFHSLIKELERKSGNEKLIMALKNIEKRVI